MGPLGTYSISDMYDLFIIILETVNHVMMLWLCGIEGFAMNNAG